MPAEDTNESGKQSTRDYLRRVAEERAALPEEQRVDIENPSKYAPPLGVDSNGKPLRGPSAEDDRP